MSELFENIEQLKANIEAAQKELSALCHGKRFMMSIPMQQDDPDIVIGAGLRVGKGALDSLDAERKRADAWRGMAEKLVDLMETTVKHNENKGAIVTSTFYEMMAEYHQMESQDPRP